MSTSNHGGVEYESVHVRDLLVIRTPDAIPTERATADAERLEAVSGVPVLILHAGDNLEVHDTETMRRLGWVRPDWWGE